MNIYMIEYISHDFGHSAVECQRQLCYLLRLEVFAWRKMSSGQVNLFCDMLLFCLPPWNTVKFVLGLNNDLQASQ